MYISFKFTGRDKLLRSAYTALFINCGLRQSYSYWQDTLRHISEKEWQAYNIDLNHIY